MKTSTNKGITLIALVITVIVLLILAGTAISIAVNGGNIFAKANTAVDTYNQRAAQQQAAIEALNTQFNEYYTGYDPTSKTITYNANGGNGTMTATIGTNPQVVTSTFTAPEGYEFAGWNTSADGTGTNVAVGTTITANVTLYAQWTLLPWIPTGLAVGDTVNWTPSGTYTNWLANYYSDDDTKDVTLYAGAAATAASAATSTNWSDATTAINMTIQSWKVLDVDTVNNVVTLVPSAPTASGVKLRGAQGYNNAVKLLNDACSALYGNYTGVTAKSINIEDIEGLMDATALSTAKGNGYPVKESSAYTASNSKYPKIYEEEALRDINGTYSVTGIGMSEPASTTADTNGFISRSIGKVTNATSIQPSKTYYDLSNSDFTTALGTTNAGLILPNGSSTRDYWLASRCVGAYGSFCRFGVRGVSGGSLDFYRMFISSDGADGNTHGLFPVVSLSSGVLTETATAGTYTFTPAS